jgi:hypothetical protein
MFAKTGQHLIGAIVACLAFIVQAVVIYVALLARAVVTDPFSSSGGLVDHSMIAS